MPFELTGVAKREYETSNSLTVTRIYHFKRLENGTILIDSKTLEEHKSGCLDSIFNRSVWNPLIEPISEFYERIVTHQLKKLAIYTDIHRRVETNYERLTNSNPSRLTPINWLPIEISPDWFIEINTGFEEDQEIRESYIDNLQNPDTVDRDFNPVLLERLFREEILIYCVQLSSRHTIQLSRVLFNIIHLSNRALEYYPLERQLKLIEIKHLLEEAWSQFQTPRQHPNSTTIIPYY